MKPDLSVEIAGIRMKNPVMVASGTFGYGDCMDELYDIGVLGAVVVKSISLYPMEGNPQPRICEVPCGMINSIGLQNIGVERFLKEKMPHLKGFSVPIIVSIFGKTINEYVEVAKRLGEVDGISALEVNISCPNIEKGGIHFGNDPVTASELIENIKRETRLPLFVKLPPVVGDVKGFIRILQESGTDAFTIMNTIPAMAVDVKRRKPLISTVTGGLSGPAIKPIALRQVWEAFQVSRLPIIGVGGIMNAIDALEFLIVGAAAIQVGTANFLNPMAPVEIIEGIESYLIENRMGSIRELVGSLRI